MKTMTYYFEIRVHDNDWNVENTWVLGNYDTAEAAMKAALDWFKDYPRLPVILSLFNGYIEGYIKRYFGLEVDDETFIDRIEFSK